MPHESRQEALARRRDVPTGWLSSALELIGGLPFLPPLLDPFERGGIQFPGFFEPVPGRTRRRRRRRALSQGDKNDIAFIAATVSKSAAGTFATQLAARSR